MKIRLSRILKEETTESYQRFLAELYQIYSSLDHVDVKILDNLSAASRGVCLPHKSILVGRKRRNVKMRNSIDFTDRELYCVALAIESHLCSRETYFTKKSAIMFNRMIKKVVDEGLKRKNPKSILHPIMKFED